MFRGLLALLTHCGLAFALMFAVAIIGVAVTGPTMSAAQRTVLVVGVLDLVIAGGTIWHFAVASGSFSSGVGRVVWTVVGVGAVAVVAAAMFFVSVLSLNR
jgi:hypothetical protein